MAEKSNIGWTDHTYNPWYGCEKVSPACDNCYAEEWANRFNMVEWGGERRLASVATRQKPYAWDKACANTGRRDRVFSLSLGDWLDDEVPAEWLEGLLQTIAHTPNLDWLLLSKRPRNWRQRLEEAERTTQDEETAFMIFRWLEGMPPENVWVGATVENKAMAKQRIPALLEIPAKIRFLSVEPMLEGFSVLPYIKTFQSGEGTCGYEPDQIHWIICGGESGKDARLFDFDWARRLLGEARAIGAEFFMKQSGCNAIAGDAQVQVRGNGEDVLYFPEDLRVQEFPLQKTGENCNSSI